MKISLLGCGWLGLPLAKILLAKGFSVNGSVTSAKKLAVLQSFGIIPFQIEIGEDKIDGDMTSFLENSEILIIDIPPKAGSSDFTKKMKNLIPFIEESGIEKVIFISSTSVYAEENKVVTEAVLPNPATESGRQLVVCEQLFQKNESFKTTILRFGGLIGEDRHPVKYLSGKKNENPNSPVNLIHQEDCIGIISKIIKLGIYGEIFNAAAPFHPTRKEYYTQKAQEYDLPLPQFVDSENQTGKIVSAEKIEKILGYLFARPNI